MLCKALLDLKPAGEHFSDPGKLGEAYHSAIWYVSYVHLLFVSLEASTQGSLLAYLPSEWDKVVLAERVDLNVFDDHKLVVVFVEDGAIYNLAQILLVPFGKE